MFPPRKMGRQNPIHGPVQILSPTKGLGKIAVALILMISFQPVNKNSLRLPLVISAMFPNWTRCSAAGFWRSSLHKIAWLVTEQAYATPPRKSLTKILGRCKYWSHLFLKYFQTAWPKNNVENRVNRGETPKEWVQYPFPICRKPEGIVMAVAGGEQSGHSYWMQSGHGGYMAKTMAIQLPAAWEDLLRKAEEDLGPMPDR